MSQRFACFAVLLSLAVTSFAGAAEWKFNFGGDISGTAGYEDYAHADNAYNASTGYGWTFTNDPGADGYNGMLYRDRTDAGEDPDPTNTLVLDLRAFEGEQFGTGGDGALLRDPFTFRVDLPNGVYTIQAGMGDPLSKLVSTVTVGDAFHSTGNTTALDESDENSRLLPPSGNFTNTGEYETLPLDGTVGEVTFEVTQGYMLLGYRRTEGSVRYGGLNDVVITAVPEPASLGLLGAGVVGLGWRRRAVR